MRADEHTRGVLRRRSLYKDHPLARIINLAEVAQVLRDGVRRGAAFSRVNQEFIRAIYSAGNQRSSGREFITGNDGKQILSRARARAENSAFPLPRYFPLARLPLGG